MQTIALWLFVINLGIAFGAGIYEHRIVVPRWIGGSRKSGVHWNAEAAIQDDTGRRFWACVSTLPLTLLTLVNLFFAWQSSGDIRGWWLASALAALADRVITFSVLCSDDDPTDGSDRLTGVGSGREPVGETQLPAARVRPRRVAGGVEDVPGQMTPEPKRRVVRRTLCAGLVYGLAAVAFTWPLVLHLRSLFGVVDPAGDASLYLWTLSWDLTTLSVHPTWLLTGRVFDANIFFPAPHTLAYSDHLLLQSLVLWPVFALTHDVVLCYNLLLIASLVATALTMHLLARAVVGSEWAAYVAGLIFGFAPYHFTHLGHIQLQALYWLPLSLLFLHRLFTDERRAVRPADTVALGVIMGLQAVSSVYYGVIGGVGVLCAALTLAVLTGRMRDWRLIRRGFTAAAIAILVALPWSIPYLQVKREVGAGRNLFEASAGSAVLASYVQAPPENLLYGRTGWLRPAAGQRLPRKDGAEQALFPGFCALALALLGLMAAPRPLRKTAVVYTVVGLVGLLLSLGPDGIRPLYAALYQVLVGMEAIRAPARFSVLTLAGIAMLAAVAVRTLEVRAPRARLLVAPALLAIVALEFSNGSIAYPAAPTLTSNAGRWLRDQPGSGAVICLPMDFGIDDNTRCMVQSLEHGRSIVNGYSGLQPPFFAALVDAMSRMPSADGLLALHDLGVEYVVSDHPLMIDAADGADGVLREALVERARFSDQHVYQIVWSPATESTLAAETGPAPPEPGPPPFAVGESATYRIQWTSGPINLPAGEATVAVAPPNEDEYFRFVVSAKTAPWVSRFYEVDAMLETTASDRLLPIAHVESIREGKRQIDRRLEFDFARHEVRMTNGGASITLPLGADARDPISALFYLRTLPIAAGTEFLLPLTDNGRRSRLEVGVGDLETITIEGRAWPAWKLAPRLVGRIDGQAPTITTWVSADARHIPLLIDVAASFGSVRAELVSYRER